MDVTVHIQSSRIPLPKVDLPLSVPMREQCFHHPVNTID